MNTVKSILFGALKSVKSNLDPAAEFGPYDVPHSHMHNEPQRPKFSFTSRKRISIRF